MFVHPSDGAIAVLSRQSAPPLTPPPLTAIEANSNAAVVEILSRQLTRAQRDPILDLLSFAPSIRIQLTR